MSRRPMTVALTGGIGSGKTTVSNLFASLGVPVIDADEISRRVALPGGAAYPAMVQLLGPDALAADGTIRRDYARRLAFENEDIRRALEGIVHPVVRNEILGRISAVRAPYCIVSIPLLVETGAPGNFDRVLVVDAPEAAQISRTVARDATDDEGVRRIMQRQAARTERNALADDIIDNSGEPDSLRGQVEKLHRQYVELAAAAGTGN